MHRKTRIFVEAGDVYPHRHGLLLSREERLLAKKHPKSFTTLIPARISCLKGALRSIFLDVGSFPRERMSFFVAADLGPVVRISNTLDHICMKLANEGTRNGDIREAFCSATSQCGFGVREGTGAPASHEL